MVFRGGRPSSPVSSAEWYYYTMRASGLFDVKLAPQPPDGEAGGVAIGRMAIDKQFQGELEATSRGQMLAFRASVAGSAGYVAMEVVVGRLHGRSGTFVLQHSGTMTRGAQQLALTVVPDSATDQLTGLAGSMAIAVAEGKHAYTFDYTLPEAS